MSTKNKLSDVIKTYIDICYGQKFELSNAWNSSNYLPKSSASNDFDWVEIIYSKFGPFQTEEFCLLFYKTGYFWRFYGHFGDLPPQKLHVQ